MTAYQQGRGYRPAVRPRRGWWIGWSVAVALSLVLGYTTVGWAAHDWVCNKRESSGGVFQLWFWAADCTASRKTFVSDPHDGQSVQQFPTISIVFDVSDARAELNKETKVFLLLCASERCYLERDLIADDGNMKHIRVQLGQDPLRGNTTVDWEFRLYRTTFAEWQDLQTAKERAVGDGTWNSKGTNMADLPDQPISSIHVVQHAGTCCDN
jgi:hypothetical protein